MSYFAECRPADTRQTMLCCVSILDTRQSIFFFFSQPNFYGLFLYYVNLHVSFGAIIKVFSITIRFCSFNGISSDNSDLNSKSLEKCKTVNTKMISMLFSTRDGRFKEQTKIFEHHAH
jgi:hypothetical protein